ncbi:MAG: ParB/RepB/Spo0J family partition protein [Clostridia bacterium]|nr:ParB/RepB/Spo0J family partition protein [Clostridia bacterium]
MSEPYAYSERENRKSCLIPIQLIEPNPSQPRKSFDDHSLMELAASINQYGLLQPVTVCEKEGSFQLIMGERRLRACKMLGYTHIDAFVLSGAGANHAILALVENLQREELHFLEEAEAYAAILGTGMNQENLARRLGKSVSCVANKVRLLKLGHDVRRVVLEENLSERHARVLLRLPEGEKRLHMAHEIADRRLSVRETEELVQKELRTLPVQPVPRKVISLARDPRLYVNAIRAVVRQMHTAGVDAGFFVEEAEGKVTVTVTLSGMKTERTAKKKY